MKKKALLAMLLVGAMMLGACGNGEGSQGQTGTGSQSAGAGLEESRGEAGSGDENNQGASGIDMSKTLKYTVFAQADDVAQGGDNIDPVMDYWEKMFNIKLEMQYPPQGSESDQFTLMIGTGDYTDIMDLNFNTENLETLYEDGVIYELSKYVDQYMPNYKAYLDANPDVKSAMYDDEGRIYHAAVIQDHPKQWGGLVYRRDILETMTGGNVAFPSGNDEPVTIEDWDYMLPLMKQYFDAAGMADYACLIIPSTGYFATGEFMAGFGIGGLDYVDNEGKVKYGIAEENFYNYLVKMNEWFEAGYVYQDFASRSQDLFYLPNTALTYGGAAGAWFGLSANLGDVMSIPDYGLYMQVNAMASPADTAHGVETPLGVYLDSGRVTSNSGWAISTACSEEKLIRILVAFDYFYSEEGAATRTMGLSSEQGSADYQKYIDMGMEGGTRLPGTTQWTDAMNAAKDYQVVDFASNRLPGIVLDYKPRECDYDENGLILADVGDQIWTRYGNSNVLPYTVAYTVEETTKINSINISMQDYANTKIVNFIMGRDKLTPENFVAYQEQLKSLGLEEYLAIKQAAYDRYTSRAK